MAKIVDANPAGPTNLRQLATLEQHIGHPLPPEYREFLLEHNGGHPSPDAFMLREKKMETEHIVFCFFPMRNLALGVVEVDDMEELRKWPLHCAWDDLQADLKNLYKKQLNPPLLPIGTDGLSNYICVVLAGGDAGAVRFLDHKTARHQPLAPGMSAFLKSLRPRRRSDHWDQRAPAGPPALIAIDHDDYHARHIGRTANGDQFFLTTMFEPATDRKPGNEFVALFLFDRHGKLLQAKIDQFGPRAKMNDESHRAIYETRLRELGRVKFQRIEIAPFSIRRFETRFGLIPRPPEEEGGDWAVELHPGNFMAFFPPWDSGDYDT